MLVKRPDHTDFSKLDPMQQKINIFDKTPELTNITYPSDNKEYPLALSLCWGEETAKAVTLFMQESFAKIMDEANINFWMIALESENDLMQINDMEFDLIIVDRQFMDKVDFAKFRNSKPDTEFIIILSPFEKMEGSGMNDDGWVVKWNDFGEGVDFIFDKPMNHAQFGYIIKYLLARHWRK